MKKYIPLLFLLTAITVNPALAETSKHKQTSRHPASNKPAESSDHTIGVGAVIGAPTGFSLNLFTSADQSIHNVAGWFLSNDEREFILTSHYTWRRWDFESNKQAAWFYGLGGSILLLDKTDKADNPDGDEYELGPSGTLGLLYDLKPMELFLKTNVTVNFVQNTEVRADLMVGLHYNF